jgi:hypothetical protein
MAIPRLSHGYFIYYPTHNIYYPTVSIYYPTDTFLKTQTPPSLCLIPTITENDDHLK